MKKSELKELFEKKYGNSGIGIIDADYTDIWNFFDPHLKLKDPKPKIQIPPDKIQTYKEIFPNITFPSGKRARSADKEIEKAFQWFFKNYPEYADWNLILEATKYYMQEKENVNWEFATTAQYFIVKFKTPSMQVSYLADYISRVKDGDVQDNVHAGFEPKLII